MRYYTGRLSQALTPSLFMPGDLVHLYLWFVSLGGWVQEEMVDFDLTCALDY